MSAPRRARLSGADDRLLRGYAPLIGFTVLFLVMVLLAPTIAPEQLVNAADGRAISPGAAAGGPATAGGAPATGSSGATSGSPATGPGGAGAGVPAGAACPGYQVPNDPYSPPCVSWAGGDNGGATAPGVDATTITVTYRDAGLPDIGSLIAQFSGVDDYVSNQAELIRTLQVLVDYFNANYEFYGRRLQLQPFQGQGSTLDEFLGGGRSGAQADAINASQQQHAFANLWTLTQPYGDALAANGVIALDNLFMNREWAMARSPFGFNTFVDCTKAASAGAAFAARQLAGKPAAFAGEDLRSQVRRFGIIAPDSVEVRPCLDILTAALADVGAEARVVTFTPDLGTIQNQGQQIASTLAEDGVTTVLLLTDPATPFFYASGAQGIRYEPEWVLLGQAYLDFDYLAQILPGEQWAHAFGISFGGQPLPPRNTDGYRAFKQQSPDAEPSMLLLPSLYQELRMLAIGVQLAGPDLTPDTFASGLRAYQSTLGPDGTWAFPEGDFSAPQDFRIVWFDRAMVSVTNDRPGAYRDDGQRYTTDNLPAGDPPVFLDGPL